MGVEISNLSVEHIVPWLEHSVPTVELWLLHTVSQRRFYRWVLKSICIEHTVPWLEHCVPTVELWLIHTVSQRRLCRWVLKSSCSICRTYCSTAGTLCSNCRALVTSHSFSEEALQVGVEIILLYL